VSAALRVLFLGGGGLISSAAADEAVREGVELTIVTRSALKRPAPAGVHELRGDVRDTAALKKILGDREFDVVVNWVGFAPEHIAGDVDLFAGRIQQYIFISTCSVFGRPVPQLPITESSPRRHPDFQYSREKIQCEDLLDAAYRERGFPITIVRPMHTYDETAMIFPVTWTAIDRMRRGEPTVVHGDGTSLWTLMHSSDFARAFVPLMGNLHAIGESVNVVSGDILTWDQIHTTLAAAAGVLDPKLVHRSSESIAEVYPGWGSVLIEDFRHSIFFDTTKLQRLVPGFAPRKTFSQGAREIIAWHDADASRQSVSEELSAAFDTLISGS
jgi:nucleoside-diphosphate-sugar epimerase